MRVRMKKLYEAALILCGTLGWWGFIYPELSQVEEEYVEQEALPEELPAELMELLGSSGIPLGDVRIKSRILEYIYHGENKYVTTEKRCRYDK